jgi:hypothetical protein
VYSGSDDLQAAPPGCQFMVCCCDSTHWEEGYAPADLAVPLLVLLQQLHMVHGVRRLLGLR